MKDIKLQTLIQKGENLTTEFKESKSKLNKDIYETVCAFLNRDGGDILLGVSDDGVIIGIDEDKIEALRQDFLTAINNPQKLNPPCYLSADIVKIDDKKILHIFIPPSSSVHSLNGKIFDRNGDGDFNITGRHSQIADIYRRKEKSYSENEIFPYATLDDLRIDLLEKVRIRAKNENSGTHPWMDMDDMSLLKSAGLYKKDISTGQEGLTLAAILLFGKDETIQSALPHHRTDAILRKVNLDRYDDRDDIRTNLLESYERLMQFVAKHLNDPFYLEGTTRISLRNKIFREAIANILIHREYSSAYIAKMIIQKDRVVFENANKAHGFGEIDPDNFMPYPKNPTIAKVFREIGYAEELGSGVKNLYKYSKLYGGSDPKLVEDDVFTTTISLSELTEQIDRASSGQDMPKSDQAPLKHPPSSDSAEQVPSKYRASTEQEILNFCKIPRSSNEIMGFLDLKHREHFRSSILKPLIEKGLLKLTIPDKPNSPKQKYIATKNGDIPQ